MAANGIKENPTTTTPELTTAFDEWLDGLQTEHPTLSKKAMETLAESMRKNMAVRDALLMSVICAGHPEYDTDKLREYAINPTRHEHLTEWCERMMKWSLTNAGHETDKNKVAKAVKMLDDIAETVDIKLQAQPFAIIAYTLWWMGDSRAMLPAMRALAIDDECTLAALVVSAIHGDRWTGRN